MSRAVVAWDRIVTLVLALVLIAAGTAAALWWLGTFPGWPPQVKTDQTIELTTRPWWPWAVGAVGVLLILLGLRWLASHVPNRGVSHLKLPGSSSQGKLDTQVRPVVAAAADAFAATAGVRSARGTIEQERGQLIAKLRATIEPHADLTEVAAGSDQVSADLRRVLQRDDMVCQVNLTVARTDRADPRVD